MSLLRQLNFYMYLHFLTKSPMGLIRFSKVKDDSKKFKNSCYQ
jgi:hypothetical protein